MDQALNSQKTPHTSPLQASYGMSFVSILMKNDRVIKGFYCIYIGMWNYDVLLSLSHIYIILMIWYTKEIFMTEMVSLTVSFVIAQSVSPLCGIEYVTIECGTNMTP